MTSNSSSLLQTSFFSDVLAFLYDLLSQSKDHLKSELVITIYLITEKVLNVVRNLLNSKRPPYEFSSGCKISKQQSESTDEEVSFLLSNYRIFAMERKFRNSVQDR